MNVVVFDLDDTLYKEVDYVKSAFCFIADKLNCPKAIDILWRSFQRGDNAFENCKKLKAVDLPEAVCAVGHHAFADSGIKTLAIRNKYLSLTDTACLHGCRNYTIYVPEGSAARGRRRGARCGSSRSGPW